MSSLAWPGCSVRPGFRRVEEVNVVEMVLDLLADPIGGPTGIAEVHFPDKLRGLRVNPPPALEFRCIP